MKPHTGPAANAAEATPERELRRDFKHDEEAASNLGDAMIAIAISLGIALTVLVYVIAPLVADAKASPDFSDGEKAMLGLVVLVVIGGIITATWAAFKARRERNGYR